MKVYAHFLIGKHDDNPFGIAVSMDDNCYRWRTLLQFGNSWDLLGTVIMKNPGSAYPKLPAKPLSIPQLTEIDNENTWYEFTPDNTMYCIEKLFLFYTQSKQLPMKGIVQIFNLMNLRTPNVEESFERERKALDPHLRTTEKDCSIMADQSVPIYLGWGNLSGTEVDKYFKIANEKFPLLYASKEKSCFYHPQYLMGRGKNYKNSISQMRRFCDDPDFIFPIIRIDLKEVESQVCMLLSNNPLVHRDEKDAFRFNINGSRLQFTITYKEKGYVGIRCREKNIDYSSPEFDSIKSLLASDEYAYTTEGNNWIAVKLFKDYGYTTTDVVNAILNEIQLLIPNII